MKKFEYLKTINLTTEDLNELGSIGWELVNMIHVITIDKSIYVFKREINE